MKYVSVAEMVAIENEADSRGYSYSEMMEQAGKGLAEVIEEEFGTLENRMVCGLVGSGNNGGDTLVALSYLQDWGWQTAAYLVRERPEGDPLLGRVKEAGCEIIDMNADHEFLALTTVLHTTSVLMDGILGTGIRLPLRGNIGEILSYVKEMIGNKGTDIQVVAVDCPSGVDCDSGEAAPEAIPADITVTMAAVKQGLLKFPAYNLVGVLKCIGIGLPSDLESYGAVKREIVEWDWVQKLLPERPLNAHKSTFGVVLVVAGSLHYSGAALLTGEAAFRSGAGWVTLAVPEILHAALAGSFIEATWLPLPHQQGWIADRASEVVLENLDRVNTMILGPGLGLNETTQDFIRSLLDNTKDKLPPLVIDADGLKMLAEIPDWFNKLPAPAILTPHPGEMSILTREPIQDILQNRVAVAETYAKKWGHIVVLKGAFTTIASAEGQTAIIPVATPALARAGTGDVLAGLIGGFRAQGLGAFESAVVAAWIHARAGLIAADQMGSSATVLAGDVLDAVKDVFASLKMF